MAAFLLAARAAAVASFASLTDSAWLSPSDGVFSDPRRWSDGVPGFGDVAMFGELPGGPFAVSTAGTTSIGGLVVSNQSLVLELNGNSFGVLGPVAIASPIEGQAALAVRHGDLLSFGSFIVGDERGAGAVGGALSIEDGTLGVSDLTIAHGTWTLGEGANVASTGQMRVGRGSGSVAEWLVTADATVGASSHEVTLSLGSANGFGTLRLDDGASLTLPSVWAVVGGELTTEPSLSGYGTIVLGDHATLLAPLGISVGHAGVGAIEFKGSGQSIAAEWLVIGTHGGSGSLHLDPSWELATSVLWVGTQEGEGLVTVTGPEVTLSVAAEFDWSGLVVGAGGTGTMTVSKGAAVMSPAIAVGGTSYQGFRLPGPGVGHFTLAESSATAGQLFLGAPQAVQGHVTLADGSTLTAATTTVRGSSADLAFEIGVGSSLATGDMTFIAQPTLHVELSGPAATFTCGAITHDGAGGAMSLALEGAGAATIASIDDPFALSLEWSVDGSDAATLTVGVPHLVRGSVCVGLGPGGAPPPGTTVTLASGAMVCADVVASMAVEQPSDGSLYIRQDGDDLVLVRPRDQLVLDLEAEAVLLTGLPSAVTVRAVDEGDLLDVTSLATLESSDPSVLAVDGPGIMRAVSAGTATVTAHMGNAVTSSRVVCVSDEPSLTPFVLATGTGDATVPSHFVVRHCALSADGRWAAYSTTSPDLVPDDTNEAADVFLFDRIEGTVERVSEPTKGGNGESHSNDASISPDGRFVAFATRADNLIGQPSVWSQVMVMDRLLDELHLVSVAADGSLGNDDSYSPIVSADGRFVAFTSDATNLVADDANGAHSDVLLHDRLTGNTSRVGLTLPGGQPAYGARLGDLTADARWLAYLAIEDVSVLRAMLLDLDTGKRTDASLGVESVTLDPPVISDDGRWYAFSTSESDAANCLGYSTVPHVWLRDRASGTLTVPLWTGGEEPSTAVYTSGPTLSADGRFLFLQMLTCSACAGPGVGTDAQTGRIELESGAVEIVSARDDMPPDGIAWGATATSADGLHVLFTSSTTSLVPLVEPISSQRQPYLRRFGPPSGADLDEDGTVGAADLAILLSSWGQADTQADLDGNGTVDPFDLGILLGAWGPTNE